MLNKVKIGPKLIGGFLIIAFIGAVIGIFGLININDIGKTRLPAIQSLTEMGKSQNAIQYAVRGLMIAKYWNNLKTISDQITSIEDELRAIKKNREVYTALPKTKAEATEWNKLVEQALSWEKTATAMVDNGKEKMKFVESGIPFTDPKIMDLDTKLFDELAPSARAAFLEVRDLVDALIKENNLASEKAIATAGWLMPCVIFLGTLIAFLLGLFLTFSITKPLSQGVAMIQEIARGEMKEKLALNRGDELGILAASMDTLVDTLKDLIIDDGGVVLEASANKDMSKRMKKEYKGQFGKMKENINKVVENLDAALQQVSQATEQVSSASQQISAGSQSLAQGANEQASSLEEVSSSLEEMSSMTKQNAENANQAKQLAVEANNNASQGKGAMGRMSGAIGKIKESSDQTAKIVKTIDEIAMQTNLLALNAAVEAARAGEAGRGFAVVAEEVRNLAQRSAQAAKNTADMISESVKNAEEGVVIAAEVAKSFDAIAVSNSKVDNLIAEIAAASQEQSQGIDQVTTAVAQMDKVTQQNAANSEESASASEELSSQAEELQAMVGQFKLTQVVAAQHQPEKKQHPIQQVTMKPQSQSNGGFDRHHRTGQKQLGAAVSPGVRRKVIKELKAEEVIPFEDESVLKEF